MWAAGQSKVAGGRAGAGGRVGTPLVCQKGNAHATDCHYTSSPRSSSSLQPSLMFSQFRLNYSTVINRDSSSRNLLILIWQAATSLGQSLAQEPPPRSQPGTFLPPLCPLFPSSLLALFPNLQSKYEQPHKIPLRPPGGQRGVADEEQGHQVRAPPRGGGEEGLAVLWTPVLDCPSWTARPERPQLAPVSRFCISLFCLGPPPPCCLATLPFCSLFHPPPLATPLQV